MPPHVSTNVSSISDDRERLVIMPMPWTVNLRDLHDGVDDRIILVVDAGSAGLKGEFHRFVSLIPWFWAVLVLWSWYDKKKLQD